MNANEIQHILVVGAGTMGQQIALQCATHGLTVTLTDVSQPALDAAIDQIGRFAAEMATAGYLTPEAAGAAVGRITPMSDPAPVAATVDLVTESVPEDPALKARVFAELNAVCPPRTIFTTNTSSLLPSMVAGATGRPDRFAALHFHLPVWSANVADVMGHSETSAATVETLTAFARRIGQIPIVSHKENPGYVFNAMFNVLNREAITLVANGVASIEDVDRAWMGVMKMPVGPGGWLDAIGLDTVWTITDFWAGMTGDAQLTANAALLKGYLDRGRAGVKTGCGFYDYPNPAYQRSGFLTGEPATTE